MRQYLHFLTKGDCILILSLLLFSSVGVFGPRFYFSQLSQGLQASIIVIQVDGEEYKRIPLKEDGSPYTIPVEGSIGVSQVEIHGDRVRMKEAPAPDHYRIAVQTGWISRPGPMIINMPNRVAIWIEGLDPDGLDGVSW